MTQHLVSLRRVADAYRIWFDKVGLHKGAKREDLFISAIRSSLRLSNAVDDHSPLPTTRQTWNQWGKMALQKRANFRHELCIAIKAVTGEDITPDNLLSDENNFSQLVTIVGTPIAQKVSNQADEHDHETYDLSIERIAFRRSEPIRIIRKDIVPGGGDVDIGSAVLFLRAARMSVSSEGDVVPLIKELAPNNREKAYAERVFLTDNPREAGEWTIHPENGILEGSVYLPNFALAKSSTEQSLSVRISTTEAAIDAEFRPTGEELSSSNKKAKARKHLIDRILSLDITDSGKSVCLSKALFQK